MRSKNDDHELIEQCLNQIEQTRGNSFTAEQRQCAHEIVNTDLGKLTLSRIGTSHGDALIMKTKKRETINRLALCFDD